MTINFNFDAIPQYFRDRGFFKPKKDLSHMKEFFLLGWCISRCKATYHSEKIDDKLLLLQPFEFICGREKAAQETGLTENEVRNQLKRWEKQGLLKKSTNSVTNRFNAYIWSTEVFSQKCNQPSNQQVTNSQPTANHKEEVRTKNLEVFNKTTTTTNPQKLEPPILAAAVFFDCLKELPIDDHYKFQLTQEFTEERIKLAIEYFRTEPIKTTLERAIFWHCRKTHPPKQTSKPLDLVLQIAHSHNIEYQTFANGVFLKNLELIPLWVMMVWDNAINDFSQISLSRDKDLLKKELSEYARQFSECNNKKMAVCTC